MLNPEIRAGLRTLGNAAEVIAEVRHPTVSPEGFVAAFVSHCWGVVERCCRKDIDRTVILPMSKRIQVFKKARDLIHRDDKTSLNVALLARELGIPERTLNKCFRAAIGRSPRIYLRAYRLNRARDYILSHADEANVVTAEP